jgi:exodeoxyribonuclease VII small subunit
MAKQTFENAMKRLEAIVQELESGDLALDEALKRFQEGVKLSTFCSNKLDETEKKVSILLRDEEGNVREEPFLPESSEDHETV